MPAPQFEDMTDISKSSEADKNWDVCGVVIDCAGSRKISPAAAQRRNEGR
ncbi:MAG TPA: hypothetical protein VKB02_16695 [Pyrinomonadaceae bacterium]|nr:hypothetical protein [Pyrinomonadaceae bacterium]